MNTPGGRWWSSAGAKWSGSSQLIASSVSSGPVTNVARRATCRPNAKRSPRGIKCVVPPPTVGILSVPLALQARGDLTFNNKLQVSEIELLEKLGGGGGN